MLPIALVFSFSLSYCRGVLRGISRYAADRPDWTLTPLTPGPDLAASLAAVKPRGIIAHIYERKLARLLSTLNKPLINVCGIMPQLSFPRIGIDDQQVGELAARHFLDRGLRSFACIGHPAHGASIARELSFRTTLLKHGCGSDRYHVNPAHPFDPTCTTPLLGKDIGTWLKALPRPTGIFCANDILASQVVEACRQHGVAVPEHVAILGVDNDDLLCGLARPPLSSIALPEQEVGLQAAIHLDRLLRGERRILAKPLLLAPLQVVARQSTDLSAIPDVEVARACGVIQMQSHRRLSVSDVANQVGVGRRTLERRFRAVLGRGLAEEIRRCHVERAKELLADPHLSLAVVAERAGFGSGKQFAAAFRGLTGLTPRMFRQRR
ncbi:MAG: XylR family transcriptional regulator [Planctomycetes bacterium]|nr:XylR family transcriptional regulator [Planctomycetota bacterium]